MTTENYSSNSIASKNEPEKAKQTKVVTGRVKKKEKGQFKKFREDLGISDGQTVITYIFKEVLIPAFKKLISEMINNGTDIWLYGERRDRGDSRRSKISYRDYYDDRRERPDDIRRVRTRGAYDVEELIFDNYADADAVLGSLEEVVSRYNVVSVSDFYDLCGEPSPDFTANRYGWIEDDIRRAEIKPSRNGGYYIRLSRPMALN